MPHYEAVFYTRAHEQELLEGTKIDLFAEAVEHRVQAESMQELFQSLNDALLKLDLSNVSVLVTLRSLEQILGTDLFNYCATGMQLTRIKDRVTIELESSFQE